MGANGLTPLHRAVKGGNFWSINALLDAGADATIKTKDGKTPFDLAAENPEVKGTAAYWRLNDAQYK